MTRDDADLLRERLASIPDPLEFLCGLFAHAPVAFQIYRADGHCLLTNRAFRDLFGSEPPPEYNVLQDEIAREQGILGLIQRAFKGETITTPTIWYDPRDLKQVSVTEGRRVAMSSTLFPLRCKDGSVGYVALVFKDQTEEMTARERMISERDRLNDTVTRLAEAESSLAAAQRIARVGNWELDLANLDQIDRNPLRWSDEVFRIFGYEPGQIEVTNENFFKAVHPDDRAMISDAVRRSLETGAPYSIDHRVVLPDGAIRHVHEQSDIILDPATRKPIRMVGTVQDVTERKQLEEQLRESQKVEALGRLSGGVAHDFNNLLTVVLGCAELLRARTHPDDVQRKELDDIIAAGNRAAGLTRQLLAFGRRQLIAPRVINLNEVLRSMEGVLGRMTGEDIEFRFALDPDLPNVRVDPGQIEQVILNLVVNAREAMPRGGKLVMETSGVELSPEYAAAQLDVRPGRYAVVAVIDTGEGMAEHVRAHIFEPFYTTKGELGTGLGLATVYGIVKQSGGHIAVASEIGRGTTFKVYLPAVDAAAEASQSGPVETASGRDHPSTAASSPPATILLVEDEEAVRRLTARVLEDAGYRVLTAANGKEALAHVESTTEKIDLLLTDVVMPGMSGRELADRLLRRPDPPSVLYVSGYTGEAIVRRGVRRSEFLSKPFKPETLLERVRDVLGGPYTPPRTPPRKAGSPKTSRPRA